MFSINRNKVDMLRKTGLIRGVRKGNGFIYWMKEAERLAENLTLVEGDISNETTCKETLERIEKHGRNN